MGEGWICKRCGTSNAPFMPVCGNKDCGVATAQTYSKPLGQDAKCSYCGGALWICRGTHVIS